VHPNVAGGHASLSLSRLDILDGDLEVFPVGIENQCTEECIDVIGAAWLGDLGNEPARCSGIGVHEMIDLDCGLEPDGASTPESRGSHPRLAQWSSRRDLIALGVARAEASRIRSSGSRGEGGSSSSNTTR